MEVEQTMATGRIRRTAQRGIAAAVLGWLGVAAFSVVSTPTAAAAPAVTIEIKNVTPPAASVDPGGTVTFVNKIPPANQGGISIPLVGANLGATVFTDVAVTFFNQEKKLQLDQSAAWAFSAPATTGTITYTYRIVPQAGLPAAAATQVVNTVASRLPALPLPTPYVVQTIAPGVPNLPSINLPALPQVNVQLPSIPGAPAPTGPDAPPLIGGPGEVPGQPGQPEGTPGDQYAYQTGRGAPQLGPSAVAAARAFDPTSWTAGSGSGSSGSGGPGGSGGVAGGYDGATVPVFGELAGLDSAALDAEGNATTATASSAKETLPAAALAAVVALAAVTAALVRTHQAKRATR
jgi:hypothetical protein